MKIALWIAHILLIFMFGMTGYMKAFTPIEELASRMDWVTSVPVWIVRLAAVSELSAVLALIAIPLIKRYTFLVPLAAAGLTLIMVGSLFVHVPRGEPFIFNLVIGGVAAFVAWGRWKLMPVGEGS
ncbi:MAG: DoxX family protein [Candidatus Marinimicrobia bacterium]|nr:DoxX family protein [Candidatus Neomarinimicrobiota bacterium]TFB11395.1 DoxX family protein [Candidatus Marinimicrobia bacterium MT.SAG.2]